MRAKRAPRPERGGVGRGRGIGGVRETGGVPPGLCAGDCLPTGPLTLSRGVSRGMLTVRTGGAFTGGRSLWSVRIARGGGLSPDDLALVASG